MELKTPESLQMEKNTLQDQDHSGGGGAQDDPGRQAGHQHWWELVFDYGDRDKEAIESNPWLKY